MGHTTSAFLCSGIIFNTISFALGAAALAKYLDQRGYIMKLVPKAEVHDVAYIGAISYNICASVLSFLVLGFVFVTHILERTTATASRLLFVSLLLVPTVFGLANALALTVITATNTVSFGDSVGPRVTMYLEAAAESNGTPLLYRKDAVAIATVVFAWLGWVCSVVGSVLLFMDLKRKKASVRKGVAGVESEKRT